MLRTQADKLIWLNLISACTFSLRQPVLSEKYIAYIFYTLMLLSYVLFSAYDKNTPYSFFSEPLSPFSV